MDSITQAALGAAVAEAGLGSKLGWKAIAWGAFLGTLPDLDILFYPFLDLASQLSWHRGFSHSILFTLIAAVFFAWLLGKVHGTKEKCPFKRTFITIWVVLITHVLLDCFTVYGTQIFEPFSSMRVSFDNLFIIDPFYTAPLLIGLAIAGFCKLEGSLRWKANVAGLALSSLYVLWSFTAKGITDIRVQHEIARQDIQVEKYITTPAPFNTLLWRVLIQAPGAYYVGYASLLDDKQEIRFHIVPDNHEILRARRPSRNIETLKWFSQGYYQLSVDSRYPNELIFSDLRFGETLPPGAWGATGNSNIVPAIFRWRLTPAISANGDPVRIERHNAASPRFTRLTFHWLWHRTWGRLQ